MEDTRFLHSRQFHLQPLVLEGELAMIDTELVQHCCMQVANMDDVSFRVITEFIRGTISKATLYPPPAIHMEKPFMW